MIVVLVVEFISFAIQKAVDDLTMPFRILPLWDAWRDWHDMFSFATKSVGYVALVLDRKMLICVVKFWETEVALLLAKVACLISFSVS